MTPAAQRQPVVRDEPLAPTLAFVPSRVPSGVASPAAPDRKPAKEHRRTTLSIRVLVPMLAVALLTLAVLGAAVVAERNSHSILMRELETRLLLEARGLATTGAGALLGEFPELTLHPIVREMLSERRELSLAVVVDHRGRIQGHSEARELGKEYQAPTDLRPTTPTIALKSGESFLQNRELIVATAPVAAPAGGQLGTAIVGMRRAYLESAIADSRRQQSLLLLGLLVFGTASMFVLMTVLLRPLGVLRAGLERIGRGDLDTPLVTRDRTELGQLAHAVNQMASELKTAQRGIVEKERMARELELARNIQQSLLPQGSVTAGAFVLEGAQRAAAEVGGDYYDILALEGGRIGLAIADVSGKGLGGCLVMSMLSVLLRALRSAYNSPKLLLVALEENLRPTLPRGGFVTMFYGMLDPATGQVTYASAGHTPVLVYRSATKSVEPCYGRAVPIGALKGNALAKTLRDEVIDLKPGDLMVHFTDGYNESAREDGEQLGVGRMGEIVVKHASRGPRAVIDALAAAVRNWAKSDVPMDDETLLVVGYNGTPEPAVVPSARPAAAGAAPAAAAGSAPVVTRDPLAVLERARFGGRKLTMVSELEQLEQIRGWLAGCAEVRELDERSMRLLESALYEVCANVIEHGYRGMPRANLDLWWVPDRRRPAALGDDPKVHAQERVRTGWFVLQDHGVPFKPEQRPLLDFSDPSVRRRGRGIGLDMIQRILKSIEYHPGTPEGNLTLMVFDPSSAGHH